MMDHFNKLTPAEDERLSLLCEECAEVIQAVGKITRHGYESRHPNGGPTNRTLLQYELGHVLHAISRLVNSGDIKQDEIKAAEWLKSLDVQQYLHHQEELRE